MHPNLKHVLLATTVLGLASAATLPSAHAAAPAPSWRIVHTNTAKIVGTDVNQLNDIVALGPKNVWAVGEVEKGGFPTWSLAQHWNGKKWHATKLPQPFARPTKANRRSTLGTVAASGPKNVWAFGRAGSGKYALRWNGRKWTIAHHWKRATGPISDALVLGPRNVWVFGGGLHDGSAFGTWHYDGRVWTRVPTPGFRIITASAAAPDNIWAVVTKHTMETNDARFIARYDGRRWSLMPTPKLPSYRGSPAAINAISARSASDVWAVGGYERSAPGGSKHVPFALRWDGTDWKRFDGPNGRQELAGLSSVVRDGRGGIWAVRGVDIVRFTDGKWTAAKLPKIRGKGLWVNQLARTPGSGALWATGLTKWGAYPLTNGIVLRYGR